MWVYWEKESRAILTTPRAVRWCGCMLTVLCLCCGEQPILIKCPEKPFTCEWLLSCDVLIMRLVPVYFRVFCNCDVMPVFEDNITLFVINTKIHLAFWNLQLIGVMKFFRPLGGGQGRSVGTATRNGLDAPALEPRWGGGGRNSHYWSRPSPRPTQPPVQCEPGRFPGGKSAGAWRWPPTTSSAECKERIELYLYSPSGLSWPVIGWPLHLPKNEEVIWHGGKSCNEGRFVMRSPYQIVGWLREGEWGKRST